MLKTLGFGQIDWTGLKSVLLHTLVGAALSLALVLIGIFQTYSYGIWTPLIMTGFVFVTAFIKKTAETYSVVVPVVPTPTNAVGPSNGSSTTTKQ